MSAHSPGPWRLDPAYQSVVVDGDGEQVASVVGHFVDGQPDETNARLIAAAPELLALVRKVAEADVLAGEVINPDGLSLTEEDRAEARALLSRIEPPVRVSLLGWYDRSGGEHLSSWTGDAPLVDVVVLGVNNPSLARPVTIDGVEAELMPDGLDIDAKIAHAVARGGVYAFGWALPT